MNYKTALLSAARYLESQYEIDLDVNDVRAVVMLRTYAKTLQDDMMVYYWDAYKKSYRERPKYCGESLYTATATLQQNHVEVSSQNTSGTKEWINNVDVSTESKRFIRLPSVT